MEPCGDFSPSKHLGLWEREEDHDLFQPPHLTDRGTDDERLGSLSKVTEHIGGRSMHTRDCYCP